MEIKGIDHMSYFRIPQDVLMGQGGCGSKTYDHDGNKRYRLYIAEHKERYKTCTNRKEKREVGIDVFNKIKSFDPPGRFLRYDKVSSRWNEIDNHRAMQKIMHAFRELD